MGLSTKQVSGDRHELDNWSQALLQSSELPKPPSTNKRQHQQPPEQLNCPRCDSTNTKFCYYNNYNKSQPRHFCKACKRHWTKGGTLRNVPVGGGRKNKRHKTSHVTTTTTAATTTTTTPSQPQFSNLSDSPYQAIHQPPIFGMGNFMGLPPNDQNLHFSFSSLNSNSDMNLSSTSNMEASIQSSNGYKCNEKAGIMDVPQCGICEAWELAGPMELQSSSYWNWNDFDSTLVGSAGDLNIAWDGE